MRDCGLGKRSQQRKYAFIHFYYKISALKKYQYKIPKFYGVLYWLTSFFLKDFKVIHIHCNQQRLHNIVMDKLCFIGLFIVINNNSIAMDKF